MHIPYPYFYFFTVSVPINATTTPSPTTDTPSKFVYKVCLMYRVVRFQKQTFGLSECNLFQIHVLKDTTKGMVIHQFVILVWDAI